MLGSSDHVPPLQASSRRRQRGFINAISVRLARMPPPLLIAGSYVVVATIYIGVSGWMLAQWVHDPQELVQDQMLKGWLSVLLNGAVLYWMTAAVVKRLRRANAQLVQSHEQTLHALVDAMDARHKETSDHSERVVRMASGLARCLGLHGRELRDVKLGALLHDIGKLALPDAILLKAGKLNDEEIALMRTHPERGYRMLQRIDFLQGASAVPHCHHEKWDGSGYPQGLVGEQIPLAARIFSVVDVWDALSFPRAYKEAWPEPEVLDHLRKASGSHLDPQLVQLFLEHYDELKPLALAPTSASPRLTE